MDSSNSQEKISVNAAARMVRRNPETVRRWIWSGKLPAEKLGNQLFVRATDLETYCRERATIEYRSKRRMASAVSADTKTTTKTPEEIDKLFERMKASRERIRARMGRHFTEEEILGSIRELREGRDLDTLGLR